MGESEPLIVPEKEAEQSFLSEVISLAKNDIFVPETVAFHGTSQEVINSLIHTGHILGARYDTPVTDDIAPGDIYVYLDPKKVPISDPLRTTQGYQRISQHDDITKEDLVSSTAGYAQDIATKHGFLRSLGIPLNNNTAADYALDLFVDVEKWLNDYNLAIEYFQSLGYTQKEIERARKDNAEKKGFLLGFNSEIFPLLRWSGDFAINPQSEQGLPLSYITAIQPLGELERKYIEELKKK